MAESTKKRQGSAPGVSAGAAAGLSPRQRRFVAEYLKDQNGKQAAFRCGYSPKTAESQASRLLSNAKVRAAVNGRLEKLEITSEYILEGIKRIADVGDEEHNRLKALELLGKYRKLFTEKVEHSFSDMTDEQLQARYLALTRGKP